MNGSQIIAFRHRHGLSQAELGEKLGIGQWQISKIERGGRTSETVQRLLAILVAQMNGVRVEENGKAA